MIGMIGQGVVIRLQFIAYAGFDSGIDISHIDKKKKFFRSKLSFFTFQAYLATVVWGFVNMYWIYALLAMFGGLFLAPRIVTKGNFKFGVKKLKFERKLIKVEDDRWIRCTRN